jgi:hypothetical protein
VRTRPTQGLTCRQFENMLNGTAEEDG